MSMRLGLAAAMLLSMAAQAHAQVLPVGPYVRGELGGGFGQNVTFTDANPGAPNCDLCGARLPATVDTSVFGGGGLGYRFNPLFRADLTVDALPSLRARGTSSQAGNPSGSAPFSSLVAMANGYLDLTPLYPLGPFQPYLTAGLGVSRNDLGTFSGVLTSGPGAGLPVSEPGTTTTNFAWGAGAGIGYAVTPNLTVEVGYKFFDLGELRTGTIVTIAGAAANLTASKSDDFTVHTLSAGVRFGF